MIKVCLQLHHSAFSSYEAWTLDARFSHRNWECWIFQEISGALRHTARVALLTIILEAIVCQRSRAQKNVQDESSGTQENISQLQDEAYGTCKTKRPKYKKTFSHTPQKNWLFDIQNADDVPEPHISISATSLSRSSVTLMNRLSSLQQQQETLSHKLMTTFLVPQLSFVCQWHIKR